MRESQKILCRGDNFLLSRTPLTPVLIRCSSFFKIRHAPTQSGPAIGPLPTSSIPTRYRTADIAWISSNREKSNGKHHRQNSYADENHIRSGFIFRET